MSTSLSGSRGAAGNKIPRGYSAGRLQQFTPEQQSLYQSLFPYVSPGSALAEQAAGSEKGFAPYEDYARRQFQEATGELGSRFSGGGAGLGFGDGDGAMSARRGSGFQNLATQGAQDFASQLAMQRQGLQRQALMDLMRLSETLLGQRPSKQFFIKKQPKQSFWSKLFGTGAPIAGAAIGGAFGGPVGSQIGYGAGQGLAQGFQPTQY